MRKVVFFCLIALSGKLITQTNEATILKKEMESKIIVKDPKDTTIKLWKKGGTFALTLSQS